ncbi:MAG: hypothetical protein WCH96_00505, partial [Betaproteobacteria bacterium]
MKKITYQLFALVFAFIILNVSAQTPSAAPAAEPAKAESAKSAPVAPGMPAASAPAADDKST